ncbi:hypothetical protein RRG08_032237 [Elysia crispata]|uniref:Tyrosine-protein phosphatase domain-containing protein n=1 Tax=Elysia crispata TaxID=231223 RepID=A0AAE1E8M8_9GAST|nr:hypothetical protein RRG08_032237 [Elysia crispata]
MSKSLASYIGIKVAQLKVMCGLSVDLEAIEDKAVNSVSPDPIAANKFQSVYRQRLRNKQLDLEFKAIGKSCEDHSTNAALRNVLLNVKQDVVTYDHSRVIVWDIPVTVGTDYYNASFVDGYNGPKEYIAVQGPSSKCLASFWHLVWQERVTCIVMATGLFENAVQQCDKYWVDHTRKYSRHGDIHIWHERSIYLAKLNIRTFRIQKAIEY